MPASGGVVSRVLVASLIVISVWLFWRRFGKVVHHVLRARPDADFKLGSISRRIWDFFWEVLCQAKVIRERPLPGIAHAFVFWAFCAFALVTLNHLATGLGIPFLASHSWFGGFYFWLAFVV